ncbi:MAG: hypothetical protein NTZ03_10785 [Actinobacteria bacterium]|nr:hypothetical protein [Actinomycetota bacterium]
MPRSLEYVLAHADELADRFEAFDPRPDDALDPQHIVRLRSAVQLRAEGERALLESVGEARSAGYSWAAIGVIVGTTGEAARQRYGPRLSA